MNRAIKAATPRKSGGCIKELEVPTNPHDPTGETKRVTQEREVVQAALQHINRHFRQVYGTPPTTEEFIATFGNTATRGPAQQVLEGSFEPSENMDPHMAALLRQLERRLDIEPINPIITTQEFQDNWKYAREKTASSPHNAHFGHFKVIARDKKLSTIMAKLMSVPILTGFLPQTYKKMTACLLQKKAGVYKVGKMRTIVQRAREQPQY